MTPIHSAKRRVICGWLAALACAGTTLAGSPTNTAPTSAVAIGPGAAADGAGSVAIGAHAHATGYPGIAGGSSVETVAVGENALAAGWRCTALGAQAKAGVVSATAVGRGAYAWGAHNIALGRGAYMETLKGSPDQGEGDACGIAGGSLWLGGMMGNCTVDRTGDTEVIPTANGGDGKARWPVRSTDPRNYTIHGMDAFDARFLQAPELYNEKNFDPNNRATWVNRVSKDVPGGDVTLAAGRGTGTGAGGGLVLQTAPAGSVSANHKNKLETALAVDTNRQKGQTRLLLLDLDTGKLTRVVVHHLEVGGKTYRVLGFPEE